MKHSPNRAVLAGKRVMLVDDSIVRGTTSVKVVRMVREAGAKEVHLRSPRRRSRIPDFYGIDMPERDQLLAARIRGGDARSSGRRQPGLPVGRGPLWAMGAGPRDPAARSSPTTISPATTRPRLLDRRSPRSRCRGSCRSWRGELDT